ncbi:tyrosine--tRNA ligase [Candidatus Parcubacteria bacterium]|nr:tyrosine--tRNA ligase [Candidatus Parcubacteria bacterium]
MKLSEILKERGYVYQHSGPLEEITDGQKRTLYLGIDPTADSMHVGHLQAMLVLRRFLEDGHNVIVLLGGGTGMIGDPSGRSEERNLLDEDTLAQNLRGMEAQAKKLFQSDKFRMMNNLDWLGNLVLIDFLRDIGKHFSVNAMTQRDSVKDRLENREQGISYTEFSYMLLQAYDFLHLHEAEKCDLQLGASDQWGNMVSGIDLIRRKTGDTAYALSFPLLINKSTGKKFGKSEGGAVWLDPKKTSPHEFYQFWFNTSDEDVEEYLLKMTLLSKAEINEVMRAQRENPASRAAQKKLASEVTALVHGDVSVEAPTLGVSGKKLRDLVSEIGVSMSELRRLVEQGAVMLNDNKIQSIDDELKVGELKVGKHRFFTLTK